MSAGPYVGTIAAVFGKQRMRMSVRDVLRRLKDEGWVLIGQRGSHRQFVHPIKPGRVTVAGQDSEDMRQGTLSAIFRQAGWK